MTSIKWILFFCVFIITSFSSGTGQELKSSEFIEEEILENSESRQAADNCDTGKCKKTKCNCCPGYGINPATWFLGRDDCKKCNCGKTFGCTFVKSTEAKTCLCPTGYSEKSGYCNADCKQNPCKNGGKCTVETGNDVVCKCKENFSGEFCEKRDSCFSNPCKNGGTCVSSGDKVTCKCPIGITGTYCEKGNPCSSNPCKNGGTCVSSGGKATCSCPPRFSGNTCETDKCKTLKCLNNGNCIIKDGNPVCNCSDRYSGKDCRTDKCSLISCQHDGKCNIKDKKAICTCTEDYAGEFCEDHKCSLIKCKNGGQCEVKNGTATCNCTDRYFGVYCEIDKCTKIKCENGGKCDIKNGKAVCNCTDTYVGDKCEKKCNCKNGKCNELSGKISCICYPEFGKYKEGDCRACNCGKGANCTFTPGVFLSDDKKTCICPRGFKEKDGACVDPDTHNPCRSNPCKNGASCEKDGVNAKCICLPGYNGAWCEKDVCKPNPCKNSGTCKRDTGKAVCFCKDAYTGDKCQTDKCSLIACMNGGKCKIVNTNATCECPDNYTGDTCQTERCSLLKCQNGGKCKVKNKNAVCTCSERYSGTFCELDKCSLINCQNGGKCDIKKGKAFCVCGDRFTGDSCEIDKCSQINCQNGGKCYIKNGIALCNCTDEFTGDKCDKEKCSSIKCENGGKCYIKNGTAVCNCTDKFIGDHCEIELTTYSPTTPPETTAPTSTPKTETPTSTPKTATTTTTPETTTPATTPKTTNPTTSTTEQTNTSTEMKSDKPEAKTTPTTQSSSESTSPSSTTKTTVDAGSTTFTTESVTIPTLTTSEEEPTTISGEKDCKRNFCKNGGACVKDHGVEKCVCRYPFAGKTCEDDYWCTSIGKDLCNEQECTFDYSTRIGRCVCASGQYYDYNNRMCQSVDKCPLTPNKCTKPNEECRNNTCECKDNYKRSNNKECVPNFCDTKAKAVCGSNSECKENAKNPENVICQCKFGYVFTDNGCVQVDKCHVPGILGCQQICEPKTETCSCFPGYEIQDDKKSCKLKNESYKCSKDCKPGVCSKIGKEEICYCPVTHVYKNGTCKDLCTAGSLPSNMCPGNLCEPHSDLGFRCKCEGKWTYDVNKVTCIKKLMCSEEDRMEMCANKSAKCVEDDKHGFKCVCAETDEMDNDGICKNKCELKKHQDSCRARLAECDMQGSEVKCKCPTLLTFNEKDVCTELAASFSGELPFYKEKYASTPLYSPGRNASEPNYVKMKQDLRNSMQLIYGKNYRFADIKSCKDAKSSLICSVEITFNSDPKDQYKLIGSSETCIPGDSNTCFIPPELVLVKKAVNTNILSQTDPCTDSIKLINCGGNQTICQNTASDKRNFECACAEGFESYSTVYPVSDRRTVIHKCQDINECLLPRACPNRTRCLNTYGSYECLCNEGYRPVNVSSSPKMSGCVAVCGSDTCSNGVCEIQGFNYRCRCKDDYAGPDCKQKIERAEEHKGAQVALIALSTIVVPLALFAAYMVYKYRLLNRKLENANFLDDNSSTISMEPLRAGLRP